MANPAPGRIVKTRDGRFQIILRMPDGSVKRAGVLAAGTNRANAKKAALRAQVIFDTEIAPTWGAPAADAAPRRNADWLRSWLRDREVRKVSNTAENEQHWRLHVAPVLGDKWIGDWEPADLRKLVAALDDKVTAGRISWRTALAAWTTVRAMLRDAAGSKAESLRIRETNPARDVKGPDRGDERDKEVLYPSEAATLLACEAVPVQWRVGTALALYTWLRDGELCALQWGDVDLQRGLIHVRRSLSRRTGSEKSTKSGHSRIVPIELALRPLLEALREAAGNPDATALVLPSFSGHNHARRLRQHLELAGVTRPLHADARKRALVWHDLRGSGVTWAVARGDSDRSIQERAGHSEWSTTERYIRMGRTLAAHTEGFGVPFDGLPESLLRAVLGAEVIAGSDHLSAPGRNRTCDQRFRKTRQTANEAESEQFNTDSAHPFPSGIQPLPHLVITSAITRRAADAALGAYLGVLASGIAEALMEAA